MLEREVIEDDGISLFEFWEIVRDGWRWLAGGTALGAVGASLTIALSPPKYEGVAVVQVGQVGQMGQAMGAPVESAVQAIERMRTGGFQLEAAKVSGYQPWLDVVAHSAKAGEEYFSLQSVKNTQLIEIRGKAGSREDAAKIANAMVQVLAKRHAELARPTIDRLNQDLVLAQDKLQSAEKDIAALGSSVSFAKVKDERFSPIALVASMLQLKQTEMFSLRQSISAIKAALAEPATQPAKVMEAVFVGEKPVSPKKGLIAVLGVLAGSIAGLLGLFVANTWKAGKRSRS